MSGTVPCGGQCSLLVLCLCTDKRKSEAADGNRSSMLYGIMLCVLIVVLAVSVGFLIFSYLSSESVVTY